MWIQSSSPASLEGYNRSPITHRQIFSFLQVAVAAIWTELPSSLLPGCCLILIDWYKKITFACKCSSTFELRLSKCCSSVLSHTSTLGAPIYPPNITLAWLDMQTTLGFNSPTTFRKKQIHLQKHKEITFICSAPGLHYAMFLPLLLPVSIIKKKKDNLHAGFSERACHLQTQFHTMTA